MSANPERARIKKLLMQRLLLESRNGVRKHWNFRNFENMDTAYTTVPVHACEAVILDLGFKLSPMAGAGAMIYEGDNRVIVSINRATTPDLRTEIHVREKIIG